MTACFCIVFPVLKTIYEILHCMIFNFFQKIVNAFTFFVSLSAKTNSYYQLNLQNYEEIKTLFVSFTDDNQ